MPVQHERRKFAPEPQDGTKQSPCLLNTNLRLIRPVPEKQAKEERQRYGAAEIYGRNFATLSPAEIRHLASVPNSEQDCPFRGKKCKKARGICTLRSYEERPLVSPTKQPVVTVCPERFLENGLVARWIAETLLGTSSPSAVTEVSFLSGPSDDEDEEGKPVGRIDTILVCPGTDPLQWCAVELQAVYFSGKGMKTQFDIFAKWEGPGLPFPNEVRRPDFRSSGPKRLMPQLQTKVPTLRRWGKKMAVVTDRAFFETMGKMEEVADVSNCDIVWFVLDYIEEAERFYMGPAGTHFITLERAIEGLIAGAPVSLNEFERRISAKLSGHRATRSRVR